MKNLPRANNIVTCGISVVQDKNIPLRDPPLSNLTSISDSRLIDILVLTPFIIRNLFIYFYIYSSIINYNSKSYIYSNIQKLRDFVSSFGLKSVSDFTHLVQIQ